MVIHPRFRGKKLAVTKECMVHNEMAPRFYPWQHRFESRGYIALWPDRSPRPWTCKIQWAGLTEQSWTNASANETFCEQSPVEIVRNFPEILWEPKSPERILRLWEVRMWSHPRLWQEKSIYGFWNRVTKKKRKVMMKGMTMSCWYVDRLSSLNMKARGPTKFLLLLAAVVAIGRGLSKICIILHLLARL